METQRNFIKELASWPIGLLVLCVRIYQMTLSKILGNRCRFHPSCSTYFIDVLNKYGLIKGLAKGIWRICRCHPFHPGGYDPA